MTGLSTDLECVILKSNASCSFWNKADYESIKQGNPLMIFVTIYTIHQNKSFLCVQSDHSLGPLKDIV